jgi:hypothetical protein
LERRLNEKMKTQGNESSVWVERYRRDGIF